jgi:hypothetical protein
MFKLMDIEESIKVEITQFDIEDGVPEDEFHCPIAVAIRRTLKPFIVEVSAVDVELQYGDGRYEKWTLSEEGKMFVSRFDDGLPVTPFTLELTNKRHDHE